MIPSARSGIAPGYLWQFLGPRVGQPFRPFPAQFECLDTVKVPWPGMQRRPNGALIPYPTIFGINCGRRLGKTTMAEVLTWHGFTAPDDFFGPPTVRITADTFEHGRKIWDRFVWHAENTELKALIRRHDRSRFFIEGINGATLQLLSAENPQALAGDGVTTWIVDEAQYLSYAAWENLFPSTAERDGVIALFGVSEGVGPFREICYKGDSPEYPEYMRLCYPTAANPYVPRWRIEFARNQYTPSKFKQLYLAQWDDDTGKIFVNVRGCVNARLELRQHMKGWGEIEPYKPGHDYFGGIDLALHSDWTVFTICDRHGRLVAWDRFHQGSWQALKARLFELSKAYNHPLVWVDSTGSGDPIYEDLLRMGMNVQGYKIGTNEKKRLLVDELVVRIGAGNMEYPEIQTMIRELERYEIQTTPGGVQQYSAPAGEHDDFVIALALTAHGLPRPIAQAQIHQLTGHWSEDPYAQDVLRGEPGIQDFDDELRQYILEQERAGQYPENVLLRGRSEADYIS